MPLLLAVLAVGCGRSGQAISTATSAPTVTAAPAGDERPLAGLAAREVVLLPVQRVDVAGVPAGARLGEALDRELAFALRERGVSRGWTMADGSRSLAGRNPSMGLTPDQLPLPAGARFRSGDALLEPLAGQLRSLAALAGARYAVVPLLLGADPAGGTGIILHMAVADVRTAQLIWVGNTVPVELPVGSPALAARVAARFADLVAPPGAP